MFLFHNTFNKHFYYHTINIPQASYTPYIIIENAKTIFARERVSFLGEAEKLDTVEDLVFEDFELMHIINNKYKIQILTKYRCII